MIKASFVLPVKNGERFIKATLDSLAGQSEKNIEIIVINDHSSDKTVEIVEEAAKKDERIILGHNLDKTGEASTRNIGVRKAKGKIILPNDADDPSSPERAEISIKMLETKKVDFFYGNLVQYNLETGEKSPRFFQKYDEKLLRFIDYIPHPAIAYLKSAYESAGGYDEEIKIGTDYDLWLTAQEKGLRFYGEDIELARYTIHAGQMTSANYSERHIWLKKIRQKHSIFEVDMDYVQKNASPEVINFFVKNEHYRKIWFDPASFPEK